jgi:hypothetical protein
VAATTATAGIIVGVITLTGLGLKVAGLIVTLAGSSLLLTIIYAALAVWVLGLAVPVTASYIIAAVMIVPALVQVGVAEVAAHMFVFYYAVLSEVSPPTALSPFAAAALTGGNPLRTTMLSWKYTAPAFIVPFAFTIDPRGLGLLLHASAGAVAWSLSTASPRRAGYCRIRGRMDPPRGITSGACTRGNRRGATLRPERGGRARWGRVARRHRHGALVSRRIRGSSRVWRATPWSTASVSFPKAPWSGLTRPVFV